VVESSEVNKIVDFCTYRVSPEEKSKLFPSYYAAITPAQILKVKHNCQKNSTSYTGKADGIKKVARNGEDWDQK